MEVNLPFWLCFTLYFQGNFQSTSPQGAYIWRGDLRRVFCVTGLYLGGGGGGSYMEGLLFGILQYLARSEDKLFFYLIQLIGLTRPTFDV